MSGRKNHHIPQLLQRGFGNQGRKQTQVWVYSRDREPFLTSTANYGAERDFYIHNGDRRADDAITEFENDELRVISDLQRNKSPAIGPNYIPKIVSALAHIEARSKFLRTEMILASEVFFKELRRYFSSAKNLKSLFMKELEEDPNLITRGWDEVNLDERSAELARAYLGTHLEELVSEVTAPLAQITGHAFDQAVEQMGEKIKSAHTNSFLDHPDSSERQQKYRSLLFQLIEIEQQEFLLPDTMMALVSRKGQVRPYLDGDQQVAEVLLPISSHRLLYGWNKQRVSRTSDTINRMLASCSYKNYIAKSSSNELKALTVRIGKNATAFSRKEYLQVIGEQMQ